MAFTDQDHDLFTGGTTAVDFTLSLRGPQQDDFGEYPLSSGASFHLRRSLDSGAALLTARVPAVEPVWRTEHDPGHGLKLFSEVRLTAAAGGASELLFYGFVRRLRQKEAAIELTCQDPVALLDTKVCKVFSAGGYTAPTAAKLVPAPEFGARVWKVDPQAHPDAEHSGGRPAPFRVDATTLLMDGEVVTPDRHRIYFHQGVVRLSFDPPQGAELSLEQVSFLTEGSNDPAQVVEQALNFPESEGGPGLDPGEMQLNTLGEDLPPVRWRRADGSVTDLWQALRSELNTEASLRYLPESGVYQLEPVNFPAQLELALATPFSLEVEFDGEPVADRVLVGFREREGDNLALDAQLTDLMAGSGATPYGWRGNQRLTPPEAEFALLTDGDPNTGFGYRGLSDFGTRPFVDIDLGEERFISGVELITTNSENTNSVRSSESRYLFGCLVRAADETGSFRALSSGKVRQVRPLERVEFPRERTGPVRYLRIFLSPAFDTPDESSRALGLNGIRVIPAPEKHAEANAQDSDPAGEHYAPQTLRRLDRTGPVTRVVDRSGELGTAAARVEAGRLQQDSLSPAVRVLAEVGFDPLVRPGRTVGVTHPQDGRELALAVRRVEHTPELTRLEGELVDPEGFD